jgi:hypothetical protein
MANALYALAKKKFLDADIDLLVDDLKIVLVDAADYTVNLGTHEFLSDIPAGGRVATSPNLSGKTTTAGVFDATDVVFTAVTGDPCECYVFYKDTGVAATSPLIAYFDTAGGLPITPNGADINLTFDNGANKIFALT